MSQSQNYTVGWICAIRVEYIAAQEFLDEEHDRPDSLSQHDNNHYTLGRIGKHNVVIATLPSGEYGTTSVATDWSLGGNWGGAPSEDHDIRLGDIVISHPSSENGGLLQYDLGRNIQGQEFQITGFLNPPPLVLRAALAGIQASYERKGHHLKEAVGKILDKNPRLRRRCQQPDPTSDRLYESDIVHPDGKESCSDACGSLGLKTRIERTEDDENPVVHYGLIASANQLMKNALIRDKLARERGVLCFEMEAAGLNNHFPCLAIRGICDYSDSHKTKKWQGYAAMIAAAFARDLLDEIPPNRVEAERSIGDRLSGLQEIATEQIEVSRQQLEVQKELGGEKLLKEERKCHQVFRLTNGTKDITYEWYKDRMEERVANTCTWFLRHKHFQSWLGADSGPLLVSADPGCGKSVLAKYLIDHLFPRLATTVCYFFFKAQDQDTIRQALCALLHQLFTAKQSLIKTAMPQFQRDGPGLVNSTTSLWNIFQKAVADPQAGSVTVIIDALDECSESEALIKSIEKRFYSGGVNPGKLKFLFTSRPYRQIISEFYGLGNHFPQIHIPGEEESEVISHEVNHVVAHRVQRLSRERRWSPAIESHLRNRLQHSSHRTYLWVYLVFERLEAEDFKKTRRGIDLAIDTLPRTVNEAYEQILCRSQNSQTVRKALSIVLAACRPLTLSEMNVAMQIETTSEALDDLDLEEDDDFKARLRSWCGLFISIHKERIYFIHQTAREFLLLHDPGLPPEISPRPPWQHSITLRDAHMVLAECCIRYLDFFNFGGHPLTNSETDILSGFRGYTFSYYSALYWADHFREAQSTDSPALTAAAIRITSPTSPCFFSWSLSWRNPSHQKFRDKAPFSNHETDILLPSFLDHHTVVKVQLRKGADIEMKSPDDDRTALSCAAENGHETTVNFLLGEGANMEATEECGLTPLLQAVKNGHEAVVRLLLKRGANIKARDLRGRSPLLLSAKRGYESIVALLLEKGANIEEPDGEGRTPLLWATMNDLGVAVHLFLNKGANTEAVDPYNQTPLIWAATYGREAVINHLVENGADLEAAEHDGRTPLICAVRAGQTTAVKLLLEKGANCEARDGHGCTPLTHARRSKNINLQTLLLQKGSDPMSIDHEGVLGSGCSSSSKFT